MNIQDINVGHLARNRITENVILICRRNIAVVIYSVYPQWIGTAYSFEELEDPYDDLGKLSEHESLMQVFT